MVKDPWTQLRAIGWSSGILGALSGFRLFPFDWPGIAASFWCAWALLRRKPSGLLATAVAGGIVLADAIISMTLMGPLLIREWTKDRGFYFEDDRVFLTLQLTLYAFQICFWPWASATVLRNQEARGVVGAYAIHSRDTVVGAFCVSAWISLVLQLWAKTLVFRLV